MVAARENSLRLSAAITGLTVVGLLCLSGGGRQETCLVTLRLIDAQSGRELPGLVRFAGGDGRSLYPPELMSRGLGLKGKLGVAENAEIHRWLVLPETSVVSLPRERVTIEAFSGLETESALMVVELSGKSRAPVTVPLERFYDASARGLRSANTHLHLMKISRELADRYLTAVPKADGLDALFVSYLERVPDDRDYTSNQYRRADLDALGRTSGTILGTGEEHRHNLAGYGEGYGHVMLLNIETLIQPVSIGPGIMRMGTDGLPLRRGIDAARRDGATVIWCHNDWGLEDLPSLAAGRLDAVNIFDGSVRSSYKDSFYRYLNSGFRVPFSTGTDWFLYDFSRTYVEMTGPASVESWLTGLKAGRSFITNGPLLELRVDGKSPGETVELRAPDVVAVEARGLGRVEFGRIELVCNGAVVRQAASHADGGHFDAELSFEIDITSPCWLALRTPPPPVANDDELQQRVPRNELGRDLFAHTSAVHVTVAGRNHFDPVVAQGLLKEMRSSRAHVSAKAVFADAQERARVLDVYSDGIAALQQHMQRQTSP